MPNIAFPELQLTCSFVIWTSGISWTSPLESCRGKICQLWPNLVSMKYLGLNPNRLTFFLIVCHVASAIWKKRINILGFRFWKLTSMNFARFSKYSFCWIRFCLETGLDLTFFTCLSLVYPSRLPRWWSFSVGAC